MIGEIYRNRLRLLPPVIAANTSTRRGILKSEAVLHFSRVLHQHGVDYLQDVDSIIGSKDFEADIRQIPGQRSGTSLRYFYNLPKAALDQDAIVKR